MTDVDINDFITLPIIYLTVEGLTMVEKLKEAKDDLLEDKLRKSDPDRDILIPYEPKSQYTSFTEIEEEVDSIYADPTYSRICDKRLRIRDIAEYEPFKKSNTRSLIILYSGTAYTVDCTCPELDNIINKAYGNSKV